MKNKSLTKITALVLLVTMIALVIISGTFAKYTTQYDGAGTAIVANWDVSVTNLKKTKTYADGDTIDLFEVSEVYDLKDVTDFTTATGTDDTDVANGDTKAIVAPGTWGKIGFIVNIGATTDVTVQYGVDITSLDTEIPLQFSTNGTDWVTAEEMQEAVETAGTYSLASKTVQPRTADSSNAVTLYWKWDFEVGENADAIAANDVVDKSLGEATTKKECSITTKFVATQVD